MKNKILQIMYKLSKGEIKYNLASKQVLDLFDVSESEFENKLYAKCLEGMPDMTIDEFNNALADWVHKEVKRKQIESFNPHSR